jgi:hypothetical protein
MLRLKNPARAPENTALKTPALKNFCNIRVEPVAVILIIYFSVNLQ